MLVSQLLRDRGYARSILMLSFLNLALGPGQYAPENKPEWFLRLNPNGKVCILSPHYVFCQASDFNRYDNILLQVPVLAYEEERTIHQVHHSPLHLIATGHMLSAHLHACNTMQSPVTCFRRYLP